MGEIRDLVLLYCVDLLVPGTETLLIFTAAAHGKRAGFGTVCGLTTMTLGFKVAAALGVAALGCFLEQSLPILRMVGAGTFMLFAVYLFVCAWKNKAGKLSENIGETRDNFSKWFAVSVACVGVNPFTLAATLSLIAVATACKFSPGEGLRIALLLTALNGTWNMTLLFLSRTVFSRIITHPPILRGVYFIASGIFCFYAARFFVFVL